MIEITLAFVVGMIFMVLSLGRYRAVLVIGGVVIGISFLACVVFICVPAMMEALEAFERQNPDALHAYAVIVGSIGLIGVAYIFWDRYRNKSRPQDAARHSLDL